MAFDSGLLVVTYLVSLRVGALLLLSTIFGAGRVPVMVRAIAVLTLSVAIASGSTGAVEVANLGLADLVLASARELVNGAVLALGVFTAFAAFRMAGQLIDLQMGLSLGAVFDPTSRSMNSVNAAALNLLAVVAFFALEGQYVLLRALAFSFQRVHPGSLLALSPDAVVAQFGAMFALGLALVAPVFLCLLLVEIALATLSRAVPQMNVLVTGMPVKAMVGVGVMVAALPAAAPSMRRIFESTLGYWDRVLS